MQNTATPLALDDSPISRLIKQMATAICGTARGTTKKERLQTLRMTLLG